MNLTLNKQEFLFLILAIANYVTMDKTLIKNEDLDQYENLTNLELLSVLKELIKNGRKYTFGRFILTCKKQFYMCAR